MKPAYLWDLTKKIISRIGIYNNRFTIKFPFKPKEKKKIDVNEISAWQKRLK